jgi:hypothetical protein
MNLSFTKLKNAGLPKASAKFAKLTKSPTVKTVSIKDTKIAKDKKTKVYDFSKISKVVKLPKAKKVVALKKAIKKVKAFKYS